MHIRFERREDIARIHDLHGAAFGSTLEGDIVDALRVAGAAPVSLVAIDEGDVVGHILFSPVTITGADGMHVVGLGPMAALPDRQRRGDRFGARQRGDRGVSTKGACTPCSLSATPNTTRASVSCRPRRFGISCQFNVPDDVFMVLELVEGALRRQGRSGPLSRGVRDIDKWPVGSGGTLTPPQELQRQRRRRA